MQSSSALHNQTSNQRLIGQLLKEAGIIAQPQLDLVLANQRMPVYSEMRLGELLMLRGWVSEQTMSFFVFRWSEIIREAKTGKRKVKLGQCIYEADLITREQVLALLREKKASKTDPYSLMLAHGYISQKTMNYFIKNLFHTKKAKQYISKIKVVERHRVFDTTNGGQAASQKETFCLRY